MNANCFAHVYGCQVVNGWNIMQAVDPANIATMNYNRKRKSRGKWIVCATNF